MVLGILVEVMLVVAFTSLGRLGGLRLGAVVGILAVAVMVGGGELRELLCLV